MSVEQAVRAVSRRIRAQRAVEGAMRLALAALIVATSVLLGLKTGVLGGSAWLWLPWVAALPIVGVMVGALRPVPPLVAARLLDRTHDLRDRISSALWFAQLPAERRTPFAEACMADAAVHAANVNPERAAALRLPQGWPLALALALGVAALALIEPPARPSAKVAPPPTPPRLLHADDIDALKFTPDRREYDKTQFPRTGWEARLFNQLLEEIAERRLNRTEALLKISQFDKRLVDAYPLQIEAVERALRETGRKLGRAAITEALARALKRADATETQKALEHLSERLHQRKLNARTTRRLADGLTRAAKTPERKLAQRLARTRRDLQRLLQRQSRQGQLSPGDRRLLDRHRKQLERLERKQKLTERQERQLEQLRRQMQRAADSLRTGRIEDATRHLKRAAEALTRIQKEQRSARTNTELRQRLAQLRELLRKAGVRGKSGSSKNGRGDEGGRLLSLDRFAKLARGKRTDEKRSHRRPSGQSKEAHLLDLSAEQRASAIVELPAAASGKRSQEILAPGPDGSEPGTAKGTHTLSKPSRLDATRVNSRVQGQQSAGPTRSEVILAGADRGFVSSGYRKVFADYKHHAESVVERDEIPNGYRSYVRRYFQLIRPREDH